MRLTLLNITWDMLNPTGIANSRVIDAIAAAAGVSRNNVVITGIVHGTPGRRRHMMRNSEAEPYVVPFQMVNSNEVNKVRIWATINGSSYLNDALVAALLDPYIVDSFTWTHSHTVIVARDIQ